MESPIIKRETTKQEISVVDITLVAVLLAAGAVLRLFAPPVFGITPNFVIVMYCLAIMLVKPKFTELIGISLVAAAVCHFTTKSMIPYINFLSEPVGAVVAYSITRIPMNFSISKISFKPAVVTLLGTVASGLVYVTTLKFLILFISTPKNPAYLGLLTVVFTTAAANTIIAQLIYTPIKAAIGKKD